MFGLSWGQIAIIVLVGVFVLGPERIPTAVTWVLTNLRKLRSMAAGAQAELRKEIGPELEELRRQVADLQSLKEIQELRDLRDLHPKRLIGKNILGDEFSGGITGFLGLNQPLAGSSDSTAQAVDGSSNGTGGNGAASAGSDGSRPTSDAAGGAVNGATPRADGLNGSAQSGTAVNGSSAVNGGTASNGGGAMNGGTALNGGGATNGGGVLNGRASNSAPTPSGPRMGAPAAHQPPSMTKLAAPKVVGGAAPRVAKSVPTDGRPPFDPDGT